MADADLSKVVADQGKAIRALTQDLSRYGTTQKKLQGTTKGFRQSLGLVERSSAKLSQYWQGSRLGKMHTYAKMFGHLSKVANKYTDDKEELAEATDQLTTIQKKLLLPMMKMLPITKAGEKMMKNYRDGLKEGAGFTERFKAGTARLLATIFSFIGILAIIGFAWAVFSMAVDGADSSIVTMTEDFGPLHDAMLGIVSIISGEGGTAWQLFLGSILLIGAAFLILPAAIAPFVIAILFAIGVFKRLEGAGFSLKESMLGAVATGLTVLYTMLRPVKVIRFLAKILGHVMKFAGKGISFLKTRLPTLAKFILKTGRWLLSSGIAFIIVGLAMLFAYATGRVDGWLGTLVGLVGAALLAIGLFLSGVALLVPALIIGALAFILAWGYKNWDEIKATLSAFGSWAWNGLWSGLAAIDRALLKLFLWAGGEAAKAVSAIWDFFTQTVPEALGDTKDSIIQWVKDTDWGAVFSGIGEAIGGAIIWGMKSVMNLLIGFVNFMGSIMPIIEVPDWVPLIGGEVLDLTFGPFPKLAEGGIVTAPTLALIGEAGPEAVVPLDGNHGVGGNTINLNIDVSGVTDRSDKRALAREISDLINQELRRTGGQPTRGRY